MKRLGPLFILSLFSLLWLAACSDQPETPAARPGPAAPAAGPAGPVNGDTLVEATIGEPSNLLPALASDSSSADIISKVYNGLLKLDKDLNIVPDLAESLEIADDGLTLTFHLRRDVRWHDGQPFTSRDALFTYELMIDPNTPTAYAEAYRQVKSAEAPDDYTLIVKYDRPLARALSSWSLDLMPAHLLKGRPLDGHPQARHPIGTGPYKFESWVSGQRFTLVANDDYFDGRPHLDRLLYRIIPDLSAQMMELMSGGIDTMGLTPDQYEEKKGDRSFTANFNVFRYQSFAYTYLGFNLKDPHFQDVRVRQAISYALDQAELIEGVLLGFGHPANGPFKPDMWACNQNIKPYPYDPARAKALLAEAGWRDTNGDGLLDKDGQPFQFTILTNQGNKVREQTGLIIQARLAAIGIKVNLRIVEWAAFLKEYLDKRNFEAVVMGWTIPSDPDLYDVWHSSKTRPGELNFISYQNEEVDRLIDQARFTLDRETRKKAYDRIQEIFHEEAPYVFLYVPDALPVISSRVIGPEVGPGGLGHNFNDWYVPLDRQIHRP
ncbi:MAG: peptide-binding protein [Candidatus Adiutrix sp.]|jgi:peptide/nickel transport system substrate-binding protein|nr:peptide-binding protein [Candidatus Adiutrix sp.]